MEAGAQSASLRVGEAGASVAATAGGVEGRSYRAGARESLEVVLPDGTSVVIGAGGSVSAARYAWTGRGGEGVLRLGPGTYRISAGALGRAGRLTLLAGGGQIRVRDATVVVAVGRDSAFSAYMTLGGRAVVQAGGCTRRLSRPGFVVRSAAGGCPSRATRASSARIAADRAALRPARRVAGGTGAQPVRRPPPAAAPRASAPPPPAPRPASGTVAAPQPASRGGAGVGPSLERAYASALQLAPGIGVASPGSPNLGGSTGSSANQIFFDDFLRNTYGFSDGEIAAFLQDLEDGNVFSLAAVAALLGVSQATLETDLIAESAADPILELDGTTVTLIGTTNAGILRFPDESAQDVPLSGGPSSLAYFDVFDPGATIGGYAIGEGRVEFFVSQDGVSVTFGPFLQGADGGDGLDGLVRGAQAEPFASTQALSFHEGLSFVLHHFIEQDADGLRRDGTSFLFAGGKLADPAPVAEVRVDRYDSTFGLLGFEDDFGTAPLPDPVFRRAFLPPESAFAAVGTPPVALQDSDILLAYRPGAGDFSAQLLHADAGFDGAGGTQRSTVSVTVGHLSGARASTALQAHAYGSSRDRGQVGATLFSNPLKSSTVGGDNPNLSFGGAPGYIVVENSGGPATPQGGDIRPMRRADDTPEADFLTLRLLAATGSASQAGTSGNGPFPKVDFANRPGGTLSGYAAGLGETQVFGGTQVVPTFADAATAGYLPNLSFSFDAAENRLAAELVLSGLDGRANRVVLGGPGADAAALSAYVDGLTFGARTAPADGGLGYALASSGLVTRKRAGSQDRELVGLDPAGSRPVKAYRHMKWGLFLGDRIHDRSTGEREHIHAGSWVAGDPVDPGTYADFTGEATYTGHAIGNAFDGRSVYTALGTYTNTWDFGARGERAGSGTVTMSFDGRDYQGKTALKPGRGFVSTDLEATGRIGRIDGEFYGHAPGSDAPRGLGGQFAISNTPGAGTYRASGTFAAERP